ncbi:translocation/assembly module TamB domain-containing protein [Arenimonas sp. MALMAid1274]|uniref:translocation/assembly module TamB domain-containing protein n=1 Tax=Arenimonas sp. MALMAid1274 TaxID=3411630 RepID=UPI003BA07945
MNAPAAPTSRPPRSRARRYARRAGIGSLVLVLLLGAVLFWLLGTVSGRDSLLARVVRLLPPESLVWDRAEGTVFGPLVFHGLRYSHDGVSFTAERVLLDPQVLPVLGRRLQLDRLEVDGAVLTLPPTDDETFELPTWPGSLPRLPMPLQMAATRMDVQGLRIDQDGDTLIDIGSIAASDLRFASEGFTLASLAMDSDRGRLTLKGEYLPARNFRMDLVGTVAVPATDDTPAANLQFSAKGDLDALRLEAVGQAPDTLTLSLDLRESAAVPVWTLKATSLGLQPALFGAAPGEPWRFDLAADGRGGEADVQGEVSRGDFTVGIEPSKLALAEQVLRAQPLRLVLPQGPLQVTGELAMAGDDSRFDAVLASTGLRFESASAEPGALPVTASGEIKATGRFEAWTVEGEATLERGGEQARLAIAGDGDAEQLALDTLRADTPTGSLDGRGRVRWAPTLSFDLQAALAGFDPGYFLPDYPGAISGDLRVEAAQDEAGAWSGRGELERLSGQLRQRPVSGRVAGTWAGDRGTGEAALRIGGSVIDARGGFGARYDLTATFAPLDLADVIAGAEGRLQGRLALRGPADTLDYDAQLQGESLRWDGQRADRLRVSGTLPARGNAGVFEVDGEGLALGGIALDRIALRGRGSLAQMQLDGEAAGELGEINLTGSVGRSGAEWRGRLEQLRLAADKAPVLVLVLETPASFRYGPQVLQIDATCLAAQTIGGRLCIAANGNTATLTGDALPLALAQPWLADDDALALELDGTLDLQAELRRARDGRWGGEASLRSERGAIRLDEDLEREVFAYSNLDLQLGLAGDALTGTLAATLAADGSVSANVRTGLAADAALQGDLQLDVRELTWLELFSEDLAAPIGRLQGQITLGGTRAAPALSGQAQLLEFAAELPALGVKLREGGFTLVGNVDGSARLQGSVRSGEGLLNLDGDLNFRDASAPLQLALRGENVTLASTAELYIIGTPDLSLRWLEDRLEIRGSLTVPEARADLEALDSNVSVSPDVVVVDPMDGPRARSKPLDMQFAITLGEEVRLKGFGLDGEMRGSLSLRERPGHRATATGTLEVTGKYRAYGQALTIERARLAYADTPYDNPTLDIRAERDFDEVTVGVQVRGTARRPETTVVSSPAMETSEALAWLVFGRPLSNTTGSENEQLGAAALALGAGGNLVAQQLGNTLGLDEAGVTESRNLGGATFTVGKYVSPRLFLSYGVSLIGTGQVVTLKYLLRRGFDISIESGNESAASLNWRREK